MYKIDFVIAKWQSTSRYLYKVIACSNKIKASAIILIVLLFLFSNCHHSKKQQSSGPENKSAAKSGNKSSGTSSKTGELARYGLSPKDFPNNKLYHFVEDWYGVPYKYGGCQKEGVDCSCFVNLLYDNVYNKKISRSSSEIFNACDKIAWEDARQGDLLFFKIGGNTISHIAVFIKGNYFVHSSTSRGVIINSMQEAYYKKYFFCAGKMKNT